MYNIILHLGVNLLRRVLDEGLMCIFAEQMQCRIDLGAFGVWVKDGRYGSLENPRHCFAI
jgi:hypothetical protein